MKQRLEPQDLQGLAEEQKVRLRELWEVRAGDFYVKHFTFNCTHGETLVVTEQNIKYLNLNSAIPLLSVGQMIEILQNSGKVEYDPCEPSYFWALGEDFYLSVLDGKLCDALWLAVKKIL